MSSAAAQDVTRVPSGHSEGYREAFATLYRETATQITGGAARAPDVPDVADGMDGLRVLDAVMDSHRQGSRWVDIPGKC